MTSVLIAGNKQRRLRSSEDSGKTKPPFRFADILSFLQKDNAGLYSFWPRPYHDNCSETMGYWTHLSLKVRNDWIRETTPLYGTFCDTRNEVGWFSGHLDLHAILSVNGPVLSCFGLLGTLWNWCNDCVWLKCLQAWSSISSQKVWVYIYPHVRI